MKADSKTVAPPAPAAVAPKKKLLIVIAGAVLALGLAGGGTAWFVLHGKKDSTEHKEVKKVSAAPVFVAIEPFTVNLQPENGDQYLQLAFSLQLDNAETVELIKQNMPKVRSRLLMLLSSKKSSELTTSEGKQLLVAEIIEQIKQPFVPNGPQQEVMDVLFTSFIIQ